MRLIDADRLSEAIYDNVSALYEDAVCAKEDCLAEIEAAQTVDAVPVVRCKDCARCITYRGVTFCNKWRTFPEVELDGFCSYAERKEGADNG